MSPELVETLVTLGGLILVALILIDFYRNRP